MKSKLTNYIVIFLSLTGLLIGLVLLPLVLIFRAITELWSLMLATCVNGAGTIGTRIWLFTERLLAVFIIGCFFFLTACNSVDSQSIDGENCSKTRDTIVLKTDSCHFYMDSAYYVIDELKVEYQK